MVPVEVSQALSEMADDGLTVAGVVILAIIAVKAAKFLSLAVSSSAASRVFDPNKAGSDSIF